MQEISIVVCVIIIIVIFILHNKNKDKSKNNNDSNNDSNQPIYFDQYYYKIPVINAASDQNQNLNDSLNDLNNVSYQLSKYSHMDSDIMNSRWCSKSEGFDKNSSGSNEFSNMDIQAVPRRMDQNLRGIPVGILNNKYSSQVDAFKGDSYSTVTDFKNFSYNDKFSESSYSPEKIQSLTDRVNSRYKAIIDNADQIKLRDFLIELENDKTKRVDVDIPDRS
jgi:hypothetical protein